MVYVGSARTNEYGQGEGGEPGDQTGRECMIEPWYLHDLGWYVLRPLNQSKAKEIAQDMIYLCYNDNIGYSYWIHAHDLYNIVKHLNFNCSLVQIPCETDCAQAVRVCACYAGYDVPDFTTSTEVEVFMELGGFSLLTSDYYCAIPDHLEVGDILVTRTMGHTVVVVSTDTMPPDPGSGGSVRRCNVSRNCVLCGLCIFGKKSR